MIRKPDEEYPGWSRYLDQLVEILVSFDSNTIRMVDACDKIDDINIILCHEETNPSMLNIVSEIDSMQDHHYDLIM